MFYDSKFNGDISQWDVSKVTSMSNIFIRGKFTGDISKWKINKHALTQYMYEHLNMKDEYKPKIPKQFIYKHSW